MTTTNISLRSDPEVEKALEELGVTSDGRNRSKVVREAVIAQAKAHRQAALRTESEALAADPVDRAETSATQQDMEALRAW